MFYKAFDVFWFGFHRVIGRLGFSFRIGLSSIGYTRIKNGYGFSRFWIFGFLRIWMFWFFRLRCWMLSETKLLSKRGIKRRFRWKWQVRRWKQLFYRRQIASKRAVNQLLSRYTFQGIVSFS
jgi:hypothetical protein